ncbi:MAG: DNA-3-methyladenine glycosylase 2 family protein [Rhodospirillaceae bacterium]|nr:DNA-3-methyladenine glycosylase 2 family protein [Rhodospirillaceae bacterium]
MSSTDDISRHLGILRRRDKHIASAIKQAGLPNSRRMEPGFATLIRIIVDQQVSVAAGASIWAKLKTASNGEVTPKGLLNLNEAGLRSCGFSGQKARYALGVAQSTQAGELDFDAMLHMDDEAVRAKLIALKGIGPWTVDIYLMFGMGRPDIWPVGDLGIQNAARALMGLRKRPTPERLEKIGADWSPYRSAAALLLWHYWHYRVETAKAAKA